LLTSSFERQFNTDWRLLTRLNWSETQDEISGGNAAQFTEGSIGFAYRPAANDRWNVLGRYTYLYDLVSPDQVLNRPDQRSQVLSAEALYDVSKRWEIGAKLAARRGEVRLSRDRGPWFDNGANLAVVRTRYHFANRWDGVAEYRWLENVEVNDVRKGWLFGLYRHLGRHAKVGVGYNRTDYSDDLTNLDYDAQGWFLDVIGKF